MDTNTYHSRRTTKPGWDRKNVCPRSGSHSKAHCSYETASSKHDGDPHEVTVHLLVNRSSYWSHATRGWIVRPIDHPIWVLSLPLEVSVYVIIWITILEPFFSLLLVIDLSGPQESPAMKQQREFMRVSPIYVSHSGWWQDFSSSSAKLDHFFSPSWRSKDSEYILLWKVRKSLGA